MNNQADHDQVERELGINRVGDAILCYAAGESDRPCVRIARTAAEVKQFIIDEWLGDPESDELPEIMREISEHDWREDGSKRWEFEIGSVEFTDVFATGAIHGTRAQGLKEAEEWLNANCQACEGKGYTVQPKCCGHGVGPNAEECCNNPEPDPAQCDEWPHHAAQAIAALSSEADKR